jgi:hypothetical protein
MTTHANGDLRTLDADDAEAAAIGRMLYGVGEVDRVRGMVGVEELRFWPHRLVYLTACKLRDQGAPVDMATVLQRLRSEGRDRELGATPAAFLADLFDRDPTGMSLEHMAGEVRKAALGRQLLHLTAEFARDLADRVGPPAELLARYRLQLDELAAADRGPGREWPAAKPASEVGRDAPAMDFLLGGVIALGHITLLSALLKCGKSTLLALLLNALERGDDFLGFKTRPANVLYVTEESEQIWRDERIVPLGIADHVHFVNQPFLGKPSPSEWVAFLDYLLGLHQRSKYDLLVIDTLTNLWPVRNENDAAEEVTALMPLRKLTAAGMAVLAVHHFGKADLSEGKGARGSTALGGFVDVLLELKRFNPDEPADRCRVLTGWGRFRGVPAELVIRLSDDGRHYAAEGDRREVTKRSTAEVLWSILPRSEPGLNWGEIRDGWPNERVPRKNTVMAALKAGHGTRFGSTGDGKKASPRRYYALGDSDPARRDRERPGDSDPARRDREQPADSDPARRDR